MRELDMTGCKRKGWMIAAKDWRSSICWECKVPVGKCEWLINGRPYKGSQYYERDCRESPVMRYHIYAIVKCPHYKGEK